MAKPRIDRPPLLDEITSATPYAERLIFGAGLVPLTLASESVCVQPRTRRGMPPIVLGIAVGLQLRGGL